MSSGTSPGRSVPGRRWPRASSGQALLGTLIAVLVGFAALGAVRTWPLPGAVAAPDTIVVYGPQEFRVEGRRSSWHVERFTATVDPDAQYFIRIQNGQADGSSRVRFAFATLNRAGAGVLVGDAAGEVILPVAVEEVNRIASFLRGPRGSHITVTIFTVDEERVTLAGPETFTSERGRRSSHRLEFSLPDDATPPFRIEVTNGAEGGSGRVSAAFVRLNGRLLIGPFSVNRRVAEVVRKADLAADNVLKIRLLGRRSSFLTVTVTGAKPPDVEPPVLTLDTPVDGFITSDLEVTVSGTVEDESTVTLTVNGVETPVGADASFSALVPLGTEGDNTITVLAIDEADNETEDTRTVVRDTGAPVLAVAEPADGLVTTLDQVPVSSTVIDLTLVTVNVNGIPLLADGAGGFTGTALLAEGPNILSVTATDAAANSIIVVRNVTRDTEPPVLTVTEPADGTDTAEETIAVAGTVTDATAVTVTVNGAAVVVDVGAFGTSVALVEGENTITVVATDAAGNATTVTRSVTRSGLAEVLPLDLAVDAPPLNLTVATTLGAATTFLYTGADPIQPGVAAGTIDPVRASVIRGRVLTREGEPLSGVAITVLNHPELGSTLTRESGLFDLAVNGGGPLTVKYEKAGFLRVQRGVRAEWQDYAIVEDVVMIGLDPQMTPIDLSDATPIQVARGAPQTDADGTRQATLLFPQGTAATMVFPDGSTQPLTSLNVRATEYTVGENGPQSMPAMLPPTSGYTYAVELSVDEALAAGATEVRFNQPVTFYVENFLGLPVGLPVPIAFYDRGLGTWVPEDDGRILEVVDATPGGVAEVDTDGDGMSDDDATLALLGITSAEQETLADLYGPESSLWRIQISHFSPIDGNFPECRSASGICTSVEGPEQIPAADSTEDDPCEDGGSIIECQNQVLGERLGITGTPFALNYRSNRVPGRTINRTLEIPLTGETVPDGISGVILQVSVAGRMFSDTFPPDPNQTTTFTWDGRDAYGRTVQGGQLATVRIGYDYQLFYAVPPDVARSFGLTCDGSSTVRPGFEACIIPAELNTRARQENARFVEWQGRVGSFQSPNLGLGGWSIDVHHAYDPLVGVLHRGDGGRRSASGMGRVITTVAGTGLGGFFNSDGRPATEAMLYSPAGTAVGPDGTLYIADNLNHRIRRVGPDGIITTIAGNGLAGFRGDGPATMRRISYPQDVALGPDGILYIADRGNSLIRTVNASGYMRTIVGTPSYFGGFSGDDGPADEAKVSRPHGVLVTDDGVVYIADTGNNRIRRIGPDGIITTVAGNGSSGFGGDGGPATAARLRAPQDVAVGRDGSLYISDTGNHRIRRVGPEGIITTVAGTGVFGSGGDGGPAVAAQLGTPGGVAIGPDGALYIGDSGNRRVRWVGTDGVMRTLAGTGQNGDSGDGGLVGAAELGDPWRVGVGPDGRIFISDRSRHRLRAVAAALPGLSVGNNVIAAEDGSEVYVFDVAGRHQHTLDALTGTTRFEFGYDAAGLLTTVTDGDGNVTTIERDVDGKPLAIVAPFGQRTSLTLDGDGFLVSLTNAADESVGLTYHAGGLLATLTDPRGGVHRFTYDADGRLIRDEDPVGGFVTLERTELPNGFEVKKTTALGRTTTHRVESSALGRQFVVTSPSGFSSSTTRAADGSETMALSDGTSWTMQMAPDPDVGMQVPILNQTTLRMPSGLTSSISASRQLVLSDADPTIIVGRVDNIATNGRVYTIERDDVLRAFTTTTPEGRVGTRRTDLFGRTIETRTDGIRAFEYAYDSRGRVSQVTWGNRIWRYGYGADGRLETVTDPMSRVVGYTYDGGGRLASQIYPDGREVVYRYDNNGNMVAVVPPGRPAHEFRVDSRGVRSEYIAPDVGISSGGTRFSYNLDGQLTTIERPGGTSVDFLYDTFGRPLQVMTPDGTMDYDYDPTAGRLAAITAPSGEQLNFTFDAVLPTIVESAGEVSGTVEFTYDDDFTITAVGVNGDPGPMVRRDLDGLLIGVGDLNIDRDPINGTMTGTALGRVTSTRTHNEFAEIVTQETAIDGVGLFRVEYLRDPVGGSITGIRETIDGATTETNYTYDITGRLTSVDVNGTVTTYEYDLNDNRVSTAAPSGLVTATYDNQDRLITYGDAAYTYTAYGDLQQTVISGETTTYSYDVFSNLRAVALPNGTNVEYIIDGVNRRVGKKVNGVLVQAFLYQDRMNPVAELNGANEVISRFVYGTRPHVPDFMIKDGQTYRIVSDQIGNVRLVVNVATGEIAQRIDYDPFGRITRNSNAGFQPFGYGGGLYDDMTGLVRFGARDYDPVTGRWTTKDPQGLGGGHPNLYLFAFNDPVSLRDPFGLNPCDGVWGTPQAIFCAIMPPFGREYDYELADRDSHSGKCGSLFGDEATTHRRKRNGSPRPHYGIDLKAPLGTPIYAAVDGVITQSRDRGTPGAGNGVELTVTTEFGTIVFDYFHMDELAFDLMLGETREVMAGEMIGTSGFTGFEVSETDPHVHFQIKVNGTEIDPMALVAYFWKFRKCKCAQ